jgi:uncharacterized protein (DUF2141 family)
MMSLRSVSRIAALGLTCVLMSSIAKAEEACEGPPGPVKLFVNLEGVRSAKGLVAVTVYGDERKRFLAKQGAIYVGRVAAKPGRTRMCLHLPKAGYYALAAYHDVDGDQSFDRTRVGLPAEAYGFSRNAATLFGLPSFGSVRMPVPRTNMETSIKLKYP